MLNILNLANNQENSGRDFSYNLPPNGQQNGQQTNSNYSPQSAYSYNVQNQSQSQTQQVQPSSNGYNPNQPENNFSEFNLSYSLKRIRNFKIEND